MSVINAGTPAEMVCEGSRRPKEHLPTTVAALLVLPAVRVYMFTMRKVNSLFHPTVQMKRQKIKPFGRMLGLKMTTLCSYTIIRYRKRKQCVLLT